MSPAPDARSPSSEKRERERTNSKQAQAAVISSPLLLPMLCSAAANDGLPLPLETRVMTKLHVSQLFLSFLSHRQELIQLLYNFVIGLLLLCLSRTQATFEYSIKLDFNQVSPSLLFPSIDNNGHSRLQCTVD